MNSGIESLASQIDARPVPPFDISAVRSRADSLKTTRRRPLLAAALLVVLAPAVALAAAHYLVRVERSPNGGLQIYAQTVNATWRGSAHTLDQIAGNSPYRVVWPSMLPPYATMGAVLSAESQVTLIEYRCPGKRFASFTIMPRNLAIAAAGKTLPMRLQPRAAGRHYEWTAGAERVELDTNCLTQSQVARVRASMMAAAHMR